jgi:hypothetical protein
MRDEGMGNHHKIEQTITAIIIIINLSQIWALFCLVQVHAYPHISFHITHASIH